jgi:hypothetical protein
MLTAKQACGMTRASSKAKLHHVPSQDRKRYVKIYMAARAWVLLVICRALDDNILP